MLVVDASAAIEILIETEVGARWRDRIVRPEASLCAPNLIDIEVLSGLRRLASVRMSLAARTERAAADFADLRITRYGHVALLPRIWELRKAISAYDASYVALAETLDVPLLTCDAKLSRSHGHRAKIELLT
ncbi:MAG TPA: type II toxin-antitoxin system VapC family toxin [Rhizomicrobium sp.]